MVGSIEPSTIFGPARDPVGAMPALLARDSERDRLNELSSKSNQQGLTESESTEFRLLKEVVRLRCDLVLARFNLANFMSAKGHQNTH